MEYLGRSEAVIKVRRETIDVICETARFSTAGRHRRCISLDARQILPLIIANASLCCNERAIDGEEETSLGEGRSKVKLGEVLR